MSFRGEIIKLGTISVVILFIFMFIRVVARVLASYLTMFVLWSGLSLLPTVVGVSSCAFYILILAALMKVPSMLTSLGFMLIRIMSTFRGSVFHLFSNPLVRFFLSFVNL